MRIRNQINEETKEEIDYNNYATKLIERPKKLEMEVTGDFLLPKRTSLVEDKKSHYGPLSGNLVPEPNSNMKSLNRLKLKKRMQTLKP